MFIIMTADQAVSLFLADESATPVEVNSEVATASNIHICHDGARVQEKQYPHHRHDGAIESKEESKKPRDKARERGRKTDGNRMQGQLVSVPAKAAA